VHGDGIQGTSGIFCLYNCESLNALPAREERPDSDAGFGTRQRFVPAAAGCLESCFRGLH